MEKEAKEDCFDYKFDLNEKPKEATEPKEGSLDCVRDSVENAESPEIQSAFEGSDKGEVDAALEKSATAPGKPKAGDIGSNYIILEWEKPSERDISYYEIKFKMVNDTTWCRPVFSDFDKPCYQVRGLVPDTEYEFKVRAHYQYKEGDFSEMSDPFKTNAPVVEVTSSISENHTRKPGTPFVLDAKDDHIQLGWDKPVEKSVEYYEIKAKSSKDDRWSKPVFTENADTFYRVNHLLPDTEYIFKIRPHFETFAGEFSDESNAARTTKMDEVDDSNETTPSSRPGKPAALEVGVDYACIAWNKPDRRGIEYYEVKLKTMADESWFKIPSFTEDSKPYKKVSELASETEYEFKVRAHFQGEDDEGEFSEKSDPIITNQPVLRSISFGSTSPPRNVPKRKPGKPFALSFGQDHVDLNWDKPEEKTVTYYELKTKNVNLEAWDKMPAFTDDANTFCRIEGLSPSTQYVFKVRAHFIGGEGDFSVVSEKICTAGKREDTDEDPFTEEEDTQTRVQPKNEVKFTRTLADANLYPTFDRTNQYSDGDDVRREDVRRMVVEPHLQGGTPLVPFQRNYHGHVPGSTNYSSDDVRWKDKHRMIAELMDGTNQISFQGHPYSHVPGMVYTPDYLRTSGFTSQYTTQFGLDSMLSPLRRPSKPTCSDIKSDSIRLIWTCPDSENVLYYEVKYKQTQQQSWSKDPVTTNDKSSQVFVGGLLQDTSYVFKVRAHYKDGDEGVFSEQSDYIQTRQSPAIGIRSASTKLQDGEPAFYKLPLREDKPARNTKYKTRKCEFGSSDFLQEKTIMMIGATGSGKSTLIDGMVNHLLGVKWEDDFRFKIIDLMTEEETRQGQETESQTDWITSYRVHPKNGYDNFILNIIDTPGFGDTRGIERDHELVDQIRAFFSTTGIQGIETIDAICFVTQAPLARLTHTQKYIFEAILSIFGKNMEKNIVAMVTFADGKEPPVLNALIQAEVPYTMHFVFNNSALFEPNTEEKANRFGKMFWEMGRLSYGGFFVFLPHMQTQSLQLTAEVLEMREQLNATVNGLIPQIDIGLGDLATMKAERDLVEKFARQIEDNQNFTYMADEFRQQMVPLAPGKYVTNCTFCHTTCHYPCHVADDSKKKRCSVMRDGCCTVCSMHCPWDTHKNNDYRIEVTQHKVQKTYLEMKTKFELAEKEKVSKENILQRIKTKFISVKDSVCSKITTVRDCGNFLRQIALKSNPLTEVEYLDLLIKSAKDEKKAGFKERITMLKVLKRNAELKAKAIRLNDNDELLKQLGLDYD